MSTNPFSPPRTHSLASPRSPLYSPSLDTIPEVFEYEPLDRITSQPATPLESPDGSFVLPEPAHTVDPTVSMGPKTKGIISSPRRKSTKVACAKVSSILRKVLEADRVRRRRAMRVYLKAIVFLKMLFKAHERYGTLMAAQGAYMQR